MNKLYEIMILNKMFYLHFNIQLVFSTLSLELKVTLCLTCLFLYIF